MASSARNSTEQDPLHVDQRPTLSSLHSLSRAVHSRRAEYIRPQKIKIKIGSWNVAACPGTENDLCGWFLEGKGINKNLAGLRISDAITDNGSQENIESVGEQEARRRKKQATIPAGDEGTIIGGDDIGLYVLGLQEVVDLTSTREYIGKIYTDSGPTSKWRKALMDALPPGYVVVAEQQLSGLLLYICASPAVAPTISNVSTVSVGTGIMGYLGNKGAVTTRIVLGDTTRMVFVNSHLASGSDPTHLERRCWDVRQILERTHFDSISWAGVLEDGQERIGDEDFAFWFGDLNYRLDGLPGDDIRRLLLLHTRGEYDIGQKSRIKIDNELGDVDSPVMIHSIESDDDSSQDDDSNPRTSSTFDKYDDASSTTLPDPDDFIQDPSQDPGSLQATLDSLLPHDQLRHVMKEKKAFHDGWREGPITFLPTYKYDVGSMGMFDSSEKKRAPSWCDRILFRTRTDKKQHDEEQKQEEAAKKKDEDMKSRGMDHAGDDEDVLFDYNPEEDGDETPEAPAEESTTTGKDFYDEYDEGEDSSPTDEVLTKEGFLDKIHLDLYTSHQRVLSSDHKPLDAVFTLEYDAVDPELKSKVQQEVARELDRAENEGRPGITVVVDHSQEVDDVTTKDTKDLTLRRPSTGSAEGINFGQVSYLRRITRGLTIANTSQVTSTFAFVDRPNESGDSDRIAPPWLTVTFLGSETDEDTRHQKKLEREIKLEPGDAVNCTLSLFIDDIELVRSLNANTTALDDVLVLRVTDGRDHFIPIRATWQQSCFGRSIEDLIHIPEGGVRALVPPRNNDGPPINRGQEVRWSAPRELFKLTEAVEALTERVNADAAMIENAQLPKESASWPFASQSWLLKDSKSRERLRGHLLEALDSDKNLIESFPPEVPAIEKLEITSEILLLWLSSLSDGIVPLNLWTQIDSDISSRGTKQLTDVEETKAWVLDVLSSSPNHNISFVFLTSMLARVAAELAPLPNPPPPPPSQTTQTVAGNGASGRASLDSVRKLRALSWKGKAPQQTQTEAEDEKKRAWRMQVEKAYVDTFAGVVFRTPDVEKSKAKERKIVDERRKYVLEVFLHGGRGN